MVGGIAEETTPTSMDTRALAGVRVVDFSWHWAGPYCMRLLGDLGAEVIKIESNAKLDMSRRVPPFLGEQPTVNRYGYFHAYNRNKLSCTLNLTKPAAIELARELIKRSDVVGENFAPRVMPKLGLDYERLKALKDDLIMISLSAFGGTGPVRDHVGLGATLAAYTGFSTLLGYPGGPPRAIGIAYGDPIAGMFGAIAVLAALHHRAGTGQGQYIDVSQAETLASVIPEGTLEYVLNRCVPPRRGNRDTMMAPHNVYRCKGDDKWIAIAVTGDEQWQQLCQVMGDPAWATAAELATVAGRRQHEDEIDRQIGEWTQQHDAFVLMRLLQANGVAAGPSLNARELFEDPHLRERQLYTDDHHPDGGIGTVPSHGWRTSWTRGGSRRAPMLGEHNQEVFGGLLGLSEKEIARLQADEVIY